MSDLDRLMAAERERQAAAGAQQAARARQTDEETRLAYQRVEELVVDAAARREPWKLIIEHERLHVRRLRFLPAEPPVFGWVFPLEPGWHKYGLALTLGGRVVLMHYNEPGEKSSGGVSMLHDPYPPHATEPDYQSLGNADGVIRNGAKRFGPAVARALVTGDEWHTPVWHRGAAPFVAQLRPRLDFPGRRANEL